MIFFFLFEEKFHRQAFQYYNAQISPIPEILAAFATSNVFQRTASQIQATVLMFC